MVDERSAGRIGLRRKAVFPLLYFSEGCPVGFIWWAMPTWLRGEGLDLASITSLTAMLVLPWSLKLLWAIVFALVSAPGFEATGAMAGPFLVDHGASEQTIGWFFGVPVVIAMVVGGLLGGRGSDRLGRKRSVAIFLTGFVGWIIASLHFAAGNGLPIPWWLATMTGLYFSIGVFVAASYALFMDALNPRFGGTQFSACMAATNACESWSGWAGGRMADRSGYAMAFLELSLISLASLLILPRLGRPAEVTSHTV